MAFCARSVPKEIRIEIEKILSSGHKLLYEVFVDNLSEDTKVLPNEKWYHAIAQNGTVYTIYFDGHSYSNTENIKYNFLFSGESEKIAVKKIDDYIMVTDYNEKDMIKEGRILHIVEGKNLYRSLLISPCDRPTQKAVPNNISYEEAAKLSIIAPENYSEWKDYWRGLVNLCKQRKSLFVNKKEKLTTFTWK